MTFTSTNLAALFTTHPWTRAREAVAMMAMALGDPQAMMNLGYPSRRQRRDILSWLAPLETLLRKLLLIAAAALPVAYPRPKPRRSGPASPARTPAPEVAPLPLQARFRLTAPMRRAFTYAPTPRQADAPEPRVSLIHARSPTLAAIEHRVRRKKRGRLMPAVRLALRYQALLKVLDNPAPYARRLARRLRRKPIQARAIAEERARHDLGFFTRDIARCDPPAWDAAEAFRSNTS